LRVVWRQSREQFSHPVDLDLLVDFHADGLIDAPRNSPTAASAPRLRRS
jgi:hypothetical protein